ncbi:CHAT domain-containing protein, partial [Mycobacterium sp. E342]|uniref:CHAT domain-containing protein n=1 Tax=Mycobacterium sp. E342 TaxID=1834147 RepID=UPI0018D39C4A
MFETLFSGPVLGSYRASLGVAQQRGEPLRVVLRLTAPQLAALPWEALFDAEIDAYICRKEPLVRHVPAPFTPEPLKVTPPLRVLGLVASPRGMPALDVAAEQERLSKALAGPIREGLVELEWLVQASWDDVQDKLLAPRKWHVLHFIGHGDYDTTTDQGQIALVGEGGQANLVGADQLADLLYQPDGTLRLVVLNSCSSGEEGSQDVFSGTAAALVRGGISAVAAMQFSVSDRAAIDFARGFYSAIAHGRDVDDAVVEGRKSILGAPGTLEWVTP